MIAGETLSRLGTLADVEVLAGLGQLWRMRRLKFEQVLLFLSAERLGVSREEPLGTGDSIGKEV